MTKPTPALKPDLRFKLDMLAYKYGVNTKGVSSGQIVTEILKNTNLTTSERQILEDICKYYKCSLKDFERPAEEKKLAKK